MKIVVIGGTGLIGSKVVPRLREQGHEAVPASLSTGVNSLTGEGLADALATRNDPRTVVTDPHASYFGAELGERTLLPSAGAVIAETRYGNWPGRTAPGK
jgi:nucleoside-diphosphate-sugar epimerase